MAWAREAWNQGEVTRRDDLLARLARAVARTPDPAAPRYDGQGRRILIGYEAVRAFLAGGLAAGTE